MPRAMPPVTNGADVDSSRSRPELGAVVADGAPPPPAASFVFASADCASAVAGAAHWPSALTISSGPTGPWGPKFTFPVLARAQSGLAIKGLETPPPIFLISDPPRRILAPRNSERRSAGKSDAQIDATARQSQPRLIVCLSLKTHFASSRWRTASLGLPTS